METIEIATLDNQIPGYIQLCSSEAMLLQCINNGIFTLHGNATGTGRGNGTSKIGSTGLQRLVSTHSPLHSHSGKVPIWMGVGGYS